MDPLTMGLAAVGLGMQIWSGIDSANKSDQAYQIQTQIAGEEHEANDQRRLAMEVDARRKTLENYRKTQQLQAVASNNATNQNAQFGSGLQGGLGEISSEGTFNRQGIFQNLEIGRNLFAIDDRISNSKLALSKIQGGMATDQGIGNLGGSIFKSSDTVGKMAQGLGSFKFNVPGFNPIAGVTGV